MTIEVSKRAKIVVQIAQMLPAAYGSVDSLKRRASKHHSAEVIRRPQIVPGNSRKTVRTDEVWLKTKFFNFIDEIADIKSGSLHLAGRPLDDELYERIRADRLRYAAENQRFGSFHVDLDDI